MTEVWLKITGFALAATAAAALVLAVSYPPGRQGPFEDRLPQVLALRLPVVGATLLEASEELPVSAPGSDPARLLSRIRRGLLELAGMECGEVRAGEAEASLTCLRERGRAWVEVVLRSGTGDGWVVGSARADAWTALQWRAMNAWLAGETIRGPILVFLFPLWKYVWIWVGLLASARAVRSFARSEHVVVSAAQLQANVLFLSFLLMGFGLFFSVGSRLPERPEFVAASALYRLVPEEEALACAGAGSWRYVRAEGTPPAGVRVDPGSRCARAEGALADKVEFWLARLWRER